MSIQNNDALREEERLLALYRYSVLETPREDGFDDIVALVAQLLDAPIAAINLIDRHRQWFKAEIGLGVREMPLDNSICKHVLLESGGMVIPDLTVDERFSCNPLVSSGPNLRFYAGVLLVTPDGFPLGTLCVLDDKARPEGLTEKQRFALTALAKQVMAQMELRISLSEKSVLIEQQKVIHLELVAKENAALAAMQQAATESQKLDALLEAAPVGIVYIDASGKAIKANAETQRIWGKHPLLENAQDYQDWKRWWADGTARQGQPLRGSDWAGVRALAGENVSGDVIDIQPFDTPGIRRRIVLRASPIRDANGEISGAVIVQLDISKKEHVEAALRLSEAKFQAMTNAAPHIIFSALPDGENDYFNDQLYEFTGLTFDELKGTGWGHLVHPDDSERTWKTWEKSLNSGDPFETEFRFRHYSGEFRWILARAVAMRDAEGKIVRWMGTGTDIQAIRHTEEALRDARRRLEAAVVAADIGTWTHDITAGKIYADANFARFFGVSDDEAQGGPVSNYLAAIHPDDIERVEQRIARITKTGKGFIDTYRVRSANGVYCHIQVRGKVEKDASGKPLWLAGIAQDVTAQKESEKALARSEHKFLQLAQSNILGIVQFQQDGSFTEANDAFLSMLGYPRDELEEQGLRWDALTPPDWLGRTKEAMVELQATGTVTPYEKEYFKKDGTRIPVLIGAAYFTGSKGEGVAYVMDISSVRQAERALRESEAKFRLITNAMPQMVWATQPGKEIDYFNDRILEFTGQPAEAITGAKWANFIHPDDVAAASSKWQFALTSETPMQDEYRLRHHSGEYRWVLARALRLQKEEGTSYWMGTLTDIDEQKKAAEQLQSANERKDEFLAMLAHELRNPLAPVANAVQLLRLSAKNETRVQEITDIIERQTSHMTELVNDLLDVSRITQGLVELHKDPVDTKVVVAQAIEQVRPLIEAKGHTLYTAISAEHATVIGDQTRLIQALSNILTNAAKYTADGGEIKLAYSVQTNDVKISVQDNGSGIEATLLPHVFDLFTQARRTPDRAQGGLGLGLTLVKRITELHDGEVVAESAGYGQGSTFTVLLPLASQNDLPTEAPSGEVATSVRHATRRILVVDDNIDAVETLSMLLKEYGHTVMAASNGLEGLEIALTHSPDVIILDIGLPDMDGYELARRLCAEEETRNAVLIAITGYGQDEDKKRAHAAGFNFHLVKPVNFQEVKKLIDQ